jgi:hypothetical protein
MTDDPLERCTCCKEKFLVKRIPSKPLLVINGAGSMPDRKLYKELDID